MLNENKQKAIKQIADYAGGRGRLWKYTASHDRLVIQVRKKGEEEDIYLNLVMCKSIEVPTIWEWDSPSIRSYDNDFWILHDTEVNVICRQCSFIEQPG